MEEFVKDQNGNHVIQVDYYLVLSFHEPFTKLCDTGGSLSKIFFFIMLFKSIMLFGKYFSRNPRNAHREIFQKCIEVVDSAHCQFVLDAFKNKVRQKSFLPNPN